MSQRPQMQIFVLIDALGWRFVEGRDFLNDLLPYRSPLRTVLGFSSGAIPTILTGVPPAVTGHWNLLLRSRGFTIPLAKVRAILAGRSAGSPRNPQDYQRARTTCPGYGSAV